MGPQITDWDHVVNVFVGSRDPRETVEVETQPGIAGLQNFFQKPEHIRKARKDTLFHLQVPTLYSVPKGVSITVSLEWVLSKNRGAEYTAADIWLRRGPGAPEYLEFAVACVSGVSFFVITKYISVIMTCLGKQMDQLFPRFAPVIGLSGMEEAISWIPEDTRESVGGFMNLFLDTPFIEDGMFCVLDLGLEQKMIKGDEIMSHDIRIGIPVI